MARCISFVLLVVMATVTALAQEQRLELHIGEQREITLPPFAELKLTRKGITDARPLSNEKVLLTGLRKGFLILYALPAFGGEPLAELHITVNDAESDFARAEEVQVPACSAAGLQWLSERGIVIGETADFKTFLQCKRQCVEARTCSFYAYLNEQGQQTWLAYLRTQLGPQGDLRVSASGVASLAIGCGNEGEGRLTQARSYLDFLSLGLVSSKDLFITCQHEPAYEAYHIAAKVVLVSDSTLREWGANAYELLHGVLTADTFRRPGDPSIRALGHESQVKIIGEPIFKTIAGKPAVVSSGGEFLAVSGSSGKFMHEDHEKREVWKSYGLQLEVSVFPLPQGKIMVPIKLSFKQPTNQGEKHLRGSTLESTVTLNLDTAEIVASVTVQSLEKKEQAPSFFSQIPLLGPIFRLVTNEDAQSQLFLWIRLSKDTGMGLPAGIQIPPEAEGVKRLTAP